MSSLVILTASGFEILCGSLWNPYSRDCRRRG